MGRERILPALPDLGVTEVVGSAYETASEFVSDAAAAVSSALGTAVGVAGEAVADVGEGIQQAVTLTQLLLGAVIVLGVVYLAYNLTGDGK